jgi:hypothetical protein
MVEESISANSKSQVLLPVQYDQPEAQHNQPALIKPKAIIPGVPSTKAFGEPIIRITHLSKSNLNFI